MQINKKIMGLMLIVTLAMFLFGCGAKSDTAKSEEAYDAGSVANQSAYSSGEMAPAASENEASAFGARAAYAAQTAEQKIIKNATLRLTGKEVQEIAREIEKATEEAGGFVANSNQYKGSRDQLRLELTLRIPAGKFAAFITYLEGLGTVEEKRIYTDDVTEQYIDLAAKVKSLTIQEERLQDILSKATRVEDLLKIEQELGRVRGEIDSYTGQLRYLTNKVDFSTIELGLSEIGLEQKKLNVNNISGVFSDSKAAFIASINGLLSTISSFVVMVFAFLPFAVVLVLLAIVFLNIRRRIKNKKEENI